MPRGHVHRRKLTLWPWLIGLVLLLVALWGVAWILEPGDEIEDPARLSTEGMEIPEPVVVPAPADQ